MPNMAILRLTEWATNISYF